MILKTRNVGDNLGGFRKKYENARPLYSCHLLGSARETCLNSVNITCVKLPLLPLRKHEDDFDKKKYWLEVVES